MQSVTRARTDRAAAGEAPATVRALLGELAARLTSAAEVERPEREARELLAAVLAVPQPWVSLNPDAAIEPDGRRRALAAAEKRRRGAPLAYCVGTAAFRHLTLEVDERVLIPRPETEQLIDIVLSAAGAGSGGIAVDVGTGSGAIALALASEGDFERIIALDVSLDALAVARRNAELLRDELRTPVEFRNGSLLTPLGGLRVRLIVSNPPYIAHAETGALPASVRDWEPPIALLSGGRGLGATARLVREAAQRLVPGGALVLETDSRRALAVGELADAHPCFMGVEVIDDLAGRPRFVVARRKEDA